MSFAPPTDPTAKLTGVNLQALSDAFDEWVETPGIKFTAPHLYNHLVYHQFLTGLREAVDEISTPESPPDAATLSLGKFTTAVALMQRNALKAFGEDKNVRQQDRLGVQNTVTDFFDSLIREANRLAAANLKRGAREVRSP